MQEKLRRPGRFGDVMITHVTISISVCTNTSGRDTHMSSLHHQIDRAFPIFLTRIEKHGKTSVQGYHKQN